MKKIKYAIISCFMILLALCFFCTSVTSSTVFASVNNDGSLSLGKTSTKSTQSTFNTYGEIKKYGLYVDGDETETKKLYTTKLTNLSSIDAAPPATISFENNSVSIYAGSSSGSSNRNPYASNTFSISDNLLKASQNGYLKIVVSATASGKNAKDTISFLLYNGVNDGEIKTFDRVDINSTSDVYGEVSLENVNYNSFEVVFLATASRSKLEDTKIQMDITNPTVEFLSTDKNAPIASIDIDSGWSNQSKTLSLCVEDTESGIQYVKCNGVVLNKVSGDDKTNEYSFVVEQNGEYVFEIADNVGNIKTISHTETHIDMHSAEKPTILVNSVSYKLNTAVIASFEPDGISEEKIYYTLDGTTPTINSSVFENNVSKTISFSGVGTHTIRAVVIDEAGNIGKETSCTVSVQRHTISTSVFNADVSITKPTTFETDDGIQCFEDEEIEILFTPYDNCKKNLLKINGEEKTFESDVLTFVCTGEIDVEAYYAFQIEMVSAKTEYEYNPFGSVEIEYQFNTTENLNYDIKITKDGKVCEPENYGTYTFEWSYNSLTFVGSGQFEFEITQIEITVNVGEDQFKIYGEPDCAEFEHTIFGLPNGVEMGLSITRDVGEDVGSYSINIAHNLNENYVVHYETQSYSIRARKIVVVANSFEKTFCETDGELTYSIYQGNLIAGDTLSGELSRAEGEDVGTYDILVGTLNNSNYDILFSKGTLTIKQKPINVVIDDITVVYGEELPLTYQLSEEVEPKQITGCLSRIEGSDVGAYKISLGTLSSKNYKLNCNADGIYTITQKTITVLALPSQKVYGTVDNLQYEVSGLVDGDVLNGNLSRAEGEDVGTYTIQIGSLRNSNYRILFEQNTLTITPATLNLEIFDVEQVYGEEEKELGFDVSGVVNGDIVQIKLYRNAGSDVGEYEIGYAPIENENYVVNAEKLGVYKITKATIVPVISPKSFVYTGKKISATVSNFNFDLTFVYKQNGLECDGMIDAGTYEVQAIFAGNENYNASKSEITNVVVEKQQVFLTLAENKFIYDGTVKFPEFYYNTASGLDINTISFEFVGGENPVEVGSYEFNIFTSDSNYDCFASGVLEIANPFVAENSNGSIIECEDATFDESAKEVLLVEKSISGVFNNQSILTSCSFENVSLENDYIYTIKIKAQSGVDKVYVYKLVQDDSTAKQMTVSLEDGYYVFKVDSLTDTYLITKDIEPLPFWFWLCVLALVAIILVVALLIIKYAKRKIKIIRENKKELFA